MRLRIKIKHMLCSPGSEKSPCSPKKGKGKKKKFCGKDGEANSLGFSTNAQSQVVLSMAVTHIFEGDLCV